MIASSPYEQKLKVQRRPLTASAASAVPRISGPTLTKSPVRDGADNDEHVPARSGQRGRSAHRRIRPHTAGNSTNNNNNNSMGNGSPARGSPTGKALPRVASASHLSPAPAAASQDLRPGWDARFGSGIAPRLPAWTELGAKGQQSVVLARTMSARARSPQRRGGASVGERAHSAPPGSVFLDQSDGLWIAVSRRDIDAMEAAVDAALQGASADYLDTAANFLEAVLEGKQDEFLENIASMRERSTLYSEGPAFLAWKKHKAMQRRLEEERQRALNAREERKRRWLMYESKEANKERETGWKTLPIPPHKPR
eukprot:comp20470_c0_seq1/m.41257 comp20470_c0_seq1/g.41257  ORF comp20470_c0_seq1/g.41257 comp20470_c0_seq1/m.41257 type:complete len:312 (+) comp20470_c0_seq1:10-945(+)